MALPPQLEGSNVSGFQLLETAGGESVDPVFESCESRWLAQMSALWPDPASSSYPLMLFYRQGILWNYY